MWSVKPGDLVVPHRSCYVTENVNPSFSTRGRARLWEPGEAVLVVEVGFRWVGGHRDEVMKLRLLIDGELWWVAGMSAKHAERKHGQS